MELEKLDLEGCAELCHETNRRYCSLLGDTSQVPWSEAPEWQRASCLAGVKGVIAGNDPRKSHESWMAQKTAEGWKYGPVKNVEKKEHPCFVEYDALPESQKFKD